MASLVVKNPIHFVEEVRQEVSKVSWPTFKEVWVTTLMVIAMVAVTSIFFLLADTAIAWGVQSVLQIGR
ncbi:MAG: preprotein translocase subunit SecE [Hyphomicrobiales bacterium]|nr:MAG: preprotein translocase subunit SecE [Hyphomicrobiales bacterium]